MIPGRSANWRRTSVTTSCADRPTAVRERGEEVDNHRAE